MAAAGRTARLSVALVSTHPPRQCGIAAFAGELAAALRASDLGIEVSWVAIERPVTASSDPPPRWHISQGDAASYRRAAEQLNDSAVDIVSLQHEFGLYGRWGERFEDHLSGFLEALRKPLVTTMHTVPPQPTPSVRAAVELIEAHSASIVVMTHAARRLLIADYRMRRELISVIPHGSCRPAGGGRAGARKRLRLDERPLVLTFGLLDPRKGIHHMIGAMRSIARRVPDALYVVAGRTHPDRELVEGQAYVEHLRQLINECDVTHHVELVNSFLDSETVADYLAAADVYVTPYLDQHQVTSGTLAYALGALRAVVSTPYVHAAEVLEHSPALLKHFGCEDELAEAVTRVLQDDELRRSLEADALPHALASWWPVVGQTTASLLADVAAGAARSRPPGDRT